MRYFIDTNIFVYLFNEPDRLVSEVNKIIDDYENTLIMSVESVREILMLIKSGRTNLKIWKSYEDIKKKADEYGIEIRYITESHVKALSRLVPASEHSDPADLMIISQAIAEKIPLISSDKKFPLYEKQGLAFVPNFWKKSERA